MGDGETEVSYGIDSDKRTFVWELRILFTLLSAFLRVYLMDYIFFIAFIISSHFFQINEKNAV